MVEPFGCFAVVGGQIDGGHVAAVVLCEPSGGAAESRSDVQDVIGGLDGGEDGEVAGCRAAAQMELVDCTEVVDRETFEVFAVCLEHLGDSCT